MRIIIDKALYALLSAGILLSAACSKINDFGNINQNPGNTTQPVTSALLTNVLSGIGGYTWDAGGVVTSEGLYAQYFSETQYTDISGTQKIRRTGRHIMRVRCTTSKPLSTIIPALPPQSLRLLMDRTITRSLLPGY